MFESILLINQHSRSWVAFAFAASWYLGNPSRVQRKQQTYLKGLTKTAPRRSNCSADRYFNWTQRGRRQANKSNTATENVSQSFSLVKLVFPPPPQVERLTAACWSCTCFFFSPAVSWNPNKSRGIFFVCSSVSCVWTRGRGEEDPLRSLSLTDGNLRVH